MATILLIEDEALLRSEVRLWLTLEGHTTIEAENGRLGVKAALRHLPDLIICDITMPQLDGYGVLLELQTTPATARIPFIFLTAKATHEDIRKGMAFGADDYITKPFTHTEILEAVRIRLIKTANDLRRHQDEVEQLQHALDQEHEKRVTNAKMVAMFSHDFRNPVAAILACNELLSRYGERLTPDRRETFSKRIDVAGHQLINMLDDMLIIAQMESGRLEFSPEPQQLAQFFQHIVEEFQFMHDESHRLRFESQVEETVLVDPRLLRQITANLISNAIKYSPQGGDVSVRLERTDEQHYLLTVQDQGIGIPEADQERLFVAFQRGSNVNNLPGTGLGLAIVSQAASLHGGSISLESQTGQGTTMRATFQGQCV